MRRMISNTFAVVTQRRIKMNRFFRCLLCLVLCLALLPATGLAQQAVTNTRCKYYSASSPCDVIWYVDVSNRMHCEACCNHVENKEDPFDYVCITEWVPCTLNNDEDGECIVCGADYIKDITDDGYLDNYMTELFMVCLMEGASPLDVTISGNKAEVTFSRSYMEMLDANGIPVSESMAVPTTYTLNLRGTSFEYAGSPITPASLDSSSYGPGIWAQELGFLTVSRVTYANNDAPGTATATVTFTVGYRDTIALTKSLTVTFAITGEGEEDKYTDQEITSDDEAASISGQLTQGSTVNVTPLTPEDASYAELLGTLDAENFDVLAALDVSINGSYIGSLDVTFEVDEEYNDKTITVLHGKQDGTVETLTDVAKDGEITVTVTGFSPFILLVEKEDDTPSVPPTVPEKPGDPGQPDQPQQPENPGQPDQPQQPEKPNQPQQPEKPVAPESTAAPAAPSVPKTGDSSMPMLWLALMALAAVGFAFTSKKRLGSR